MPNEPNKHPSKPDVNHAIDYVLRFSTTHALPYKAPMHILAPTPMEKNNKNHGMLLAILRNTPANATLRNS